MNNENALRTISQFMGKLAFFYDGELKSESVTTAGAHAHSLDTLSSFLGETVVFFDGDLFMLPF